MKPRLKLEGKKFGRLAVLGFVDSSSGRGRWLCRCDCGKTSEVVGSKLTSGWTKSCGCLHSEAIRKVRYKHGQGGKNNGERRSAEFSTWSNLKNRCLNKNAREYHRYGGRGITVCERWLGENGFINFFSDMGKKPSPSHSLDRINNDGPYSKENCRWATRLQQCANTSKSRLLTHNGVTMTMNRWGKLLGFKCGTAIHVRLRNGWSLERALTTPRPERFRQPRVDTEAGGVIAKRDYSPEDELTD